ncbi:MAG TPA: hydrogenase maturation protease [Bacteroides sp.]|nr:hydrogenase maturation protease [Bacteroides sp.]
MKDRSNRILVLGVGNDIQQDVGIPFKLTEDLQDILKTVSIDFENIFVGGLELLEYMNGYKGVVFIDTIKTAEGVPGRVHLFTVENYRETLHLSCRHDVSFHMSLEIGNTLGFNITDEILIIGIEILEDLEFGAVLSKDLNSHYPDILSQVSNYVDEFIRRILISTSL